jgi:phosphoribosyl 1,2-cyclic phosphodiesterase
VHVRFWGVRGSIPAPLSDEQLRQKMRLIIAPKERRSRERDFQPSYLQKSPIPRGATYGGNTSCVELRQDGSILSLDAGSGLRELGLSLTAQDKSFETEPFSILVTHFHWDHIQGFPFFEPCYRAENRILIASALAGVEEAFRAQMAPPFFPKPLDELPATVTFKLLPVGEGVELGAFRVRAIPLAHPNGATGYRVEGGGASLVYLTDTELAATDPQMQQAIKEFCQGADLVIADTQFDRDEASRKADWGHSTIFQFIDLLAGTSVSRLALFHYDPKYTDETIDEIYYQALRYLRTKAYKWGCSLLASHEGLELILPGPAETSRTASSLQATDLPGTSRPPDSSSLRGRPG